jgi:hypothetical protein
MADYTYEEIELILANGRAGKDTREPWDALAEPMGRTPMGVRLKWHKIKDSANPYGKLRPAARANHMVIPRTTAPVITKAKGKRPSRSRTPKSPSSGPAAAAVAAPAFAAVNAPAAAPVKSETLPPIRDVVTFDQRRYQAAVALMELRDQEVLLPPVCTSSPELEAMGASWKEVQDDMRRVWVRCGGHGPSLLDIAPRIRV